MAMVDVLEIRRPDDWHVHFRDGAMLAAVVPVTAAHFGRAIVMPNLVPPVTTAAMAAEYRERIRAALPEGSRFEPLMTLYLTDHTDPADVAAGHASGLVTAVKLYPQHATTNAHFGVTDVENVMPTLERMAEIGMPLLVHGEFVGPDVDIFDREEIFIDRVLDPLRRRLPELRIVMEHITTEEAATYVAEASGNLAATITPHHLMFNRNAIFEGGIRPHYYCLPIAKRERHRLALRRAATSGNARFFLGTDTAPHPRHLKENACGCAGLFNAAVALATYAQVFDEEGALDRLEDFASLNGPAFYWLPPNTDTIRLTRSPTAGPGDLAVEGEVTVHPYRAGETLSWTVEA